MNQWIVVLLLLTGTCMFHACTTAENVPQTDKIGLSTDSTYFVLIENPAGQSPNALFDKEQKAFVESEMAFEYLLPPFHQVLFGQRYQRGILLCDAMERGAVVESKQVGGIVFTVKGKEMRMPIFIPSDVTKRTVKLENLSDILLKYGGLSSIIKTWLTHQHGWGSAVFEKWLDANELVKTED